MIDAYCEGMKVIEKVFKNRPEFFRYQMEYFGHIIEGGNPKDEVTMGNGGGGNGKKTIDMYYREIFGDYYDSSSIELLTQGRPGAGTAQPELLKLRGKLICVLNEPDKGATLMVGFLKSFSSGDVMEARPLFGNDYVRFCPMCKIQIFTNDLLNLPPEDGRALERRITVMEYKTEFHGPKTFDENNPFHAKAMNKRKLEQIIRNAAPFIGMDLLYYWYPMYKKHGLERPDHMKLRTDEYIKENNPFEQWFQDRTVLRMWLTKAVVDEDDDPNKKQQETPYVLDNDLYQDFARWFKENHKPVSKPGVERKVKVPLKEKLVAFLVPKLGPSIKIDKKNHKFGFVGWKFLC
jgi:phage/plasmid-associated DNA primase